MKGELVAKLKFWFGKEIKDLFNEKIFDRTKRRLHLHIRKGETMKREELYKQYLEETCCLSFDEWLKQGGC